LTPKEIVYDYWLEIAQLLARDNKHVDDLNNCLRKIGSGFRVKVATKDDD